MLNKNFKLSAKTRKTKKNKSLRRDGFVPAVLYGYKTENKNLKLKKNEFEKVYDEAGESGLIELSIDTNEKPVVVIKEVQKDSLSGNFIHVDFYQIDMKKKIEVEISLNFIGESEVVKTKGGILARNIESIHICALPENLINSVDIDLSNLKSFSDKIKVSDISVPKNVEITTDHNTLIANVLEPKLIKSSKDEDKKEDKDEDKKEESEEKKESDKKEEKK